MLLMHAIDNDNEGILRALLGRGADPNSTNSVGARQSELGEYERACVGGHAFIYCIVAITRIMVTHQQEGVTLLAHAVEKDRETIIQTLIDGGVDLTFENTVGSRVV